MPTLWFISCDLCYNLHTLSIQVLFRPFSTMAVNILVNFDLRSCFSRFACPNSFNSYMWEFILHGPSIGTDWCRVMIILRAQLLVTSSAECHSSSVMYWRSSIPTFTSSQCSSSHHPRATSIIFSYHFSISIAMILLYQIDLFLSFNSFNIFQLKKYFPCILVRRSYRFYENGGFTVLLQIRTELSTYCLFCSSVLLAEVIWCCQLEWKQIEAFAFHPSSWYPSLRGVWSYFIWGVLINFFGERLDKLLEISYAYN